MAKKQGLFREILSKLTLLFLLVIALLVGFYYSVSFGFFGELYSKEEIATFKNEQASVVYSEDGKIIGKYFNKNRTNVKFGDIPSHLINALVATEDTRYFEHEGIDSRSVFRVLLKSILLQDKSAGGGSTITQQLAKNMYGRKRFGVLTMPVNKCKEIILAGRIEAVFSKNEILALYLNTVPFGENVYGIEAAAKRFFNQSVSDLKIQEATVLVGMLKANSYYNPRLHPEHALSRRNTVLNQLYQYEYIQKTALDSLSQLPLTLDYANFKAEGLANYYMVRLKKEAAEILEELNSHKGNNYSLEKDGLVIQSTLNFDLQKHANSSFKEHLTVMQKRLRRQYQRIGSADKLDRLVEKAYTKLGVKKDSIHAVDLFSWEGFYTDSITTKDSLKHALSLLHAGLIAINPADGAIKTWIGGIDFRTQPYDQVLAKRQMASTFKPLLYAAALENGKEPCDYLENSPFVLSDFEGWSPENYDHESGGKYSLAAALANSKNLPTVHLFFETRFEKLDYLWNKIGFSSVLENKPSVALGTATASLFEVAIAYSMFANGGLKVEPYCIESIKTASGKVIYTKENVLDKQRLIQEETAFLMNAILQKSMQEGTGTPAHRVHGVKFPLAGKTGTAQSFSDAWFVGYNPSVVMIARVGANSPAVHFNSGVNGSGGKLALPLVAKTLAKAQKDKHLYKWLFQDFPDLPEDYFDAIDCDDFKPDNKLNQFLDRFLKKETTLEKQQEKSKKNRFNPFKKKRSK
ncbi:MAG: penicillin-binding protein 1A [Saprospiraceae bacterium]|jgi:penicillin-binding protein 1A